MCKTPMIVLGFGLLLVLVAVGCGENDECASCPEPVTPAGHARGALILAPNAFMPFLEVMSNGAVAPNLDSVKVGDSLVGRQYWTLSGPIDFCNVYWSLSFSETGDPSTFMYRHGDFATINVWGEKGSASCRLKILNPAIAAAQITDPAPVADTITPDGSDTVFWNSVEHVDYYAVMIAWYVTPGLDRHIFDYYYAADTSFIIDGAMFPPYSVREFNIHITPFTGPDPQSGRTNWSGPLLDGVVYSFGNQSTTTIIVRPLIGSAQKVPPKPAPEYREQRPEDMVANVYKRFEK